MRIYSCDALREELVSCTALTLDVRRPERPPIRLRFRRAGSGLFARWAPPDGASVYLGLVEIDGAEPQFRQTRASPDEADSAEADGPYRALRALRWLLDSRQSARVTAALVAGQVRVVVLRRA